MELEISTKDDKTIATVRGRLDTINAPKFEKEMQPLMEESVKNLVIDCSELEYIASSGLRMFLVLQKNALQKKSSLVLTGMTPNVKEVFDMTGFSKIFKIE